MVEVERKEIWTQLYNRFAFLWNSGKTHLVQGMTEQLTDISDNIHIPPQPLPHCEFCNSLQGFHAPVEYSLLQRKPNPKPTVLSLFWEQSLTVSLQIPLFCRRLVNVLWLYHMCCFVNTCWKEHSREMLLVDTCKQHSSDLYLKSEVVARFGFNKGFFHATFKKPNLPSIVYH